MKYMRITVEYNKFIYVPTELISGFLKMMEECPVIVESTDYCVHKGCYKSVHTSRIHKFDESLLVDELPTICHTDEEKEEILKHFQDGEDCRHESERLDEEARVEAEDAPPVVVAVDPAE